MTVVEAPGFAAELAAEVNRASGDDAMLLIAPMPDTGNEQVPTRIGLILPERFDAHRPKELMATLLYALSLNPVTKLLGSWALQAHVEGKLRAQEHFGFLLIDLDNFKPYNDAYGFAQGDVVIKALAGIITSTVREVGGAGDLAAHIGGDDFAVLAAPDSMDAIAQAIIEALDQRAPSFYSEQHRQEGSITVKNRKNELDTYPIMTVSIGGLATTTRPVSSYRELSDIVTDLKLAAKQRPGSNYLPERRRGQPKSD